MDTFKKNILRIWGKQGEIWLSGLDKTIDQLKEHWNLTDLKPVENMTYNYVAKALKDSKEQVVLKISCDIDEVEREYGVYQRHKDNSFVHLFDFYKNKKALLLQQAVPGFSLKSVYLDSPDNTIKIYCSVAKNIFSSHKISHHSFPHIKELLVTLDKTNPSLLPEGVLQKAIQLKDRLLKTSEQDYLLHGDLHQDNILNNGNSWLIIDPKGCIGEKYFELACFDWIHSEELYSLCQVKKTFERRVHLLAGELQLDFIRLMDWIYVRLVLGCCWALEDKLDPQVFVNLLLKLF